ncbi:hypothetical protein [Nonomuraea sp. NPDC003201]
MDGTFVRRASDWLDLADGLQMDTLRLVIAPAVVRTGRRPLTGVGAPSGLRLLHHEATPNGLLLLEYEVTGQARQGAYEGVAALT